VPYPYYGTHTAGLGRTMIEFYAKIVPLNKGMFRYCATVWKSEDGIESIWSVKKFFSCTSAKKWASKKILKSVSRQSSTMFVKETDIIRRKWND
jgi:hypothetical protein